MSLFEAVKREITPLEALQRYGFQPIKKGRRYWMLCPFHPERHPSMLVDEKIHCYGCGFHGDIVDFIGRYFHLNPLETAQKLAEDFGIPLDRGKAKRKTFRRIQRQKEQEDKLYQAYLKALNDTFQFLADLNILYTKIKASVKTPADLKLEGVVDAYHYQDVINYWLDILTDGTPQEKLQVIQEVRAWTQKQK